MKSSARRTVAVIGLALAGLVVAVVLGVIVSRTASLSVALGGADLGAGSHLVVTRTVTQTTAPTPTRHQPTTTTTAPVVPRTTTDAVPTSTSGDDDHGGSRHGDGDGDD